MSATTINIRVDSDVKNSAKKIFSELGMDLTTAINIFLRQSIREHGIPFELKLRVPNDETIKAINEVKKMEKDPSIGKSYTDVDEMMKELLA
ncbi:MAG: type II toxin-antitoxin system RelB/DinJ family antitoxin [Acutalibacteraceae bacterium]